MLSMCICVCVFPNMYIERGFMDSNSYMLVYFDTTSISTTTTATILMTVYQPRNYIMNFWYC